MAHTAIAAILTLLVLATSCNCTPTVNLGTAATFTVLAAAGVTNTGNSLIGGQVGVSPAANSLITGFEEGGTVTFAAEPTTNGVAMHGDSNPAKADIGTAYRSAADRVFGVEVIDVVNIAGLTFTPGLYKSTGALEVTGTDDLTLSGAGVYVFQMETTFQMGPGRRVTLTNGARACDVFWKVGSSATFEVGSEVKGTVLAYAAVNVRTGANIEGRLFALNEAVVLDANVITFPSA